MKTRSKASSQILILALAGAVVVFMIKAADAQTYQLAQSSSNQSQVGSFGNGQAQVVKIDLQQKPLLSRILEKTYLNYYQMFLGPTLGGSTNETYNVFQEGIDAPGTGRAPLQSFHAANIRYQINPSWAVGVSLAATNGYTNEVENRGGVVNRPDSQFFNARAFVATPNLITPIGTLYSTLSYEAPTSVISRQQKMQAGVVITESFTFNSPSPRWSYGLMGQYYRAFFNHKDNVEPPPFPGGRPTPLQTVIVSGGPFVNYRFNDRWSMGSLITLDWDQRGGQTGSREFNNNLPHRGRLGLTYYPPIKYLSSVGVFTQALLKYRNETTALGADFALRF